MTQFNVSSGVTSSGLLLHQGDALTVDNGGTAIGNALIGGTETIFAGGVDSTAFLASGGAQYVLSGGTAFQAFVADGVQFVEGGTAMGAVIDGSAGFLASQYVYSGVASDTFIESGGYADVFAEAVDTVIVTGGYERIEGFGLTTGTTVSDGGQLSVVAGGVASATTVGAGGVILASSGAQIDNSVVQSGGYILDIDGATIAGSIVEAGGFVVSTGVLVDTMSGVSYGATYDGGTLAGNDVAYALSGGIVDNVTVDSGGLVRAYAGALVSGGSVHYFGEIIAEGGNTEDVVLDAGAEAVTALFGFSATATDTIVNSGGDLLVQAGGSAVGATVGFAGSAFVYSGGNASNTTLTLGGTMGVLLGGTADGVTVAAGAALFGSLSATISNVSVASGGYLVLSGGATATNVTVQTGGQIISTGVLTSDTTSGYHYAGVSAVNLVIGSGGEAQVFSGGTDNSAVLTSGATETVFAGGKAFHTTVEAGATEYALGSGTIADTQILTGGTLALENYAYFAQSATISLDSSTDMLTVSDSFGDSATIQLSGDYSGEHFEQIHPASVNPGDVALELVACYCPGTQIRTPGGRTPIEHLAIGDLVDTQAGPQPIRWIGRRSYDARFAATNPDLMPVRIHADALADGVPARDLLISPRHALFLDDVLIPAAALVNGRTITQPAPAGRIDYIHIELAHHAVIFAEDAPAESFVDDDSRMMFHNAAEYAALYPDAPRQPARYVAARVEHGPVLDTVRRRIAARYLPAASPTAIRGYLDRVQRDRIVGWAIDDAAPQSRVTLRLRADDIVLGEAVADRPRDDLRDAGIGDGAHGFVFDIPGGLDPRRSHHITAETPDGTKLENSPLILDEAQAQPAHAAPRLRGNVDQVTRTGILGWALDEADPQAAVAVQIIADGRLIGSVIANRHRRDLVRAGLGHGRHAFDYAIEGGLDPARRHVIECRAEADGSMLGQPCVIEAATFGADLEQTIADAIAGLTDPGDQAQMLSFLLHQADQLRRRMRKAG